MSATALGSRTRARRMTIATRHSLRGTPGMQRMSDVAANMLKQGKALSQSAYSYVRSHPGAFIGATL